MGIVFFQKIYTPPEERAKTYMHASLGDNSSLHGVSHRRSHDHIVGMRAHSITEMAFVKLKNNQVIQMITKESYQTCFSSKKLTKL